MIYLHCLCITLICVLIIDIFNAIGEVSKSIFSLITNGKINAPIKGKIFYCSCCMAHWSNLLFLIITTNFSIVNYLYILVLSFLTPIFKQLFLIIEDKIMSILE